jgi:SsrA-binding protein
MIRNKKADLLFNFDYKLEVGIVLTGDEVKSITVGYPSLSEGYCFILKSEVFIKNLVLSRARNPERYKKILMHKNQINKMMGFFSMPSKIIVPLEMYRKNGFYKMLLGVGSKIQEVDKRRKIKEKEMRKEMNYY